MASAPCPPVAAAAAAAPPCLAPRHPFAAAAALRRSSVSTQVGPTFTNSVAPSHATQRLGLRRRRARAARVELPHPAPAGDEDARGGQVRAGGVEVAQGLLVGEVREQGSQERDETLQRSLISAANFVGRRGGGGGDDGVVRFTRNLPEPWNSINHFVIFIGLNSHVGIDNILEKELSWSILRCNNDGQKLHSVRRIARLTECNTKLAVALTLLEECFIRMVDPRTGVDMIPHVLYSKGSKFARLNYQGFYTIILERGDEIVCVASIRIHGTKAAELPFIATSIDYRRQGMCRRLMDIIEKILRLFHVEMLVLSAIPELVRTWMSGFGFKPIEDSERKLLHNVNLMLFPGTSLLTKRLDGTMAIKSGDEKDANDVSGIPNGKTSEHIELHDLDLSGTEFRADISVSDTFRTLNHECGPASWFQSTKQLAVGEV